MTPVDSAGPRIMWSISQIAERDGVSRQSVSKQVQGFVADHDLPVERDGRGRIAKVSLPHYDHLRGQFTNPAKVAASRPAAAVTAPVADRGDSYDEARRQEAWLKVEREKLDQARERRELVRADKWGEAAERAGREIQSLIARLPNSADELSHAGMKEGVHGVRIMLRQIAFDLSTGIADALAALEIEAPALDPALSDDPA